MPPMQEKKDNNSTHNGNPKRWISPGVYPGRDGRASTYTAPKTTGSVAVFVELEYFSQELLPEPQVLLDESDPAGAGSLLT